MKLLIIVTHPIQYFTPFFELLAKKCELKVLYTWGEDCLNNKFDPGFSKEISWDIPLLNGYPYKFLENTASEKGSHHFFGIDNPTIINDIENFAPNTILVFGWAYKSHLKVLRYFKGKIPIWFRGDSTLLQKKNIKYHLRLIFLRWVYAHVDKVFYVGRANKAYFKRCGLREEQLIWAPHAIDNDRFSNPNSQNKFDISKLIGIQPPNKLMLYAGKFEKVKNLKMFIEAFENANLENFYLLLVGNGMLEAELKKHKSDTIHFLDFQNQSIMPQVYQSCDIFCLPSISETWGLSINEAMAAGKAIFVSDRVGCAEDLVKDNGFIFKHNDFNDLIKKMKTVEAANLKNMGYKSSKYIKEWSFNKICETIITELKANK